MDISVIKDYEVWLKSLQVGQKVAIEIISDRHRTDYDVKTIKKIDGDIIEVNGFQPFKNGVIDIFVGHFTRLHPLTQEALDIADRKQLIKKLYGFDARNYSTDKLRKIYDIIKE